MSDSKLIESTSVDVDKAVPTYRNIQNGAPAVTIVSDMKTRSDTGSSSIASYRQQYRTYLWRWFMLLAVCLLNVSNGMMWLSFAPVPSFAASYYGVSVDDVDWFSIIYFVISLIVGFVAIVLLDKIGLRVPLYTGATLNLLGSCIRLLSSIHPLICSPVPRAAFYVALLGQALTAMAQPFILYSPTTLAAVWFGPKERAICTNFASVANPIGLAIVQVVTPYIVTSVDRISMMLWIYTIPAGVTFLLVLVAFWWKEPEIPPAPSSNREHIPPFFKGLFQVLKNWSFWVLLIFWGGAAGTFNALLTLLPQILCPYGYTDRDTGLWGAMMIFFGLVGATIAGLIIDYTKKYKEVSVVSMAFAALTFVWFMEVYSLTGQNVLVAASLCVFGVFALAQIPACMELGVEITYPVAESISSGLLWSAAQILGIVIVFVSQALTVPMSSALIPIQQCGSDFSSTNSSLCHPIVYNASIPEDISDPGPLTELGPAMIFTPSFTAVIFVFYVLFFWPKYKRVQAEKKASFEESMYVGKRPNSRN